MHDLKLLATILYRMPEPRRTSKGNIRHKLVDIIVIALCAIICRCDSFDAMEYFGHEREEYLREFLELPNGIPDADTFRRVFKRLDAKELALCLNEWLETEHQKRCTIAIDGKTIRGSENEKHKAFHVVSAFVAENQLTLGEVTVPEKTNEITAIPELLDLIDVEDGIVTLDAMGCQKKIVEKICQRKADYVIALKGNQGDFHSDVELFFSEFANKYPKHTTVSACSWRWKWLASRTHFLSKRKPHRGKNDFRRLWQYIIFLAAGERSIFLFTAFWYEQHRRDM